METIKIAGMTIKPVLSKFETTEAVLEAERDNYRKELLSACKALKEIIDSAHAMIYHTYRGAPVLADAAHNLLSTSNSMRKQVSYAATTQDLPTYATHELLGKILEIGDAVRDTMTELGY